MVLKSLQLFIIANGSSLQLENWQQSECPWAKPRSQQSKGRTGYADLTPERYRDRGPSSLVAFTYFSGQSWNMRHKLAAKRAAEAYSASRKRLQSSCRKVFQSNGRCKDRIGEVEVERQVETVSVLRRGNQDILVVAWWRFLSCRERPKNFSATTRQKMTRDWRFLPVWALSIRALRWNEKRRWKTSRTGSGIR